MEVILYTDGSGTPKGPCGWAFVIVETEGGEEEATVEGSGAIPEGTSNIGEMLGVIRGLEWCVTHAPDADILVRSDSSYIVNAWNEEWHTKWILRNWKNSRGRPVANKEYWEDMIALVGQLNKLVTWEHVKSHSGVKYNERCDVLAGERRKEMLEDVVHNI